MPLCENGIRSGIKLFGGLPRGAGGAFRAAAALVNADVVGAAAAPLKMAATLSSQWISVSGEAGWLSVATLPQPPLLR